MNNYQLISRLRKVRINTFLTATDQALYHELVAICNTCEWGAVFSATSKALSGSLNTSDKTLRKSRAILAEAGLISFESCKDKRVGCYYSFTKKLSNDKTMPCLTSGDFPDDTSHDRDLSSDLSSGKFPDDTQFTPYKGIKTINKGSLAPTHESTPSSSETNRASSRKKVGDETPLSYPFSSPRFMSAWESLCHTPKWKKKLNYALQLSLNKLARYEEDFAIEQIERAIESNWTGVVFQGTEGKYQEWLNLKYENNRKLSKTDKARSLLEEYQSITSGEQQSPSDAEVLNF